MFKNRFWGCGLILLFAGLTALSCSKLNRDLASETEVTLSAASYDNSPELPNGSASTSVWTDMSQNILLLHLNDPSFSSTFSDSSASGLTANCTVAACSGCTLACPESGGFGKLNSGVTFTGTQQILADLSSLPLQTANGSFVTVEFWMFWDGTANGIPIGFDRYALMFAGTTLSRHFGFTTGNNEVYGMDGASLEYRWAHVAAIFSNGTDPTLSQLYIDGGPISLSLRVGTIPAFTASAPKKVSSKFTVSGWPTNSNSRFTGLIDELAIYNGALSAEEILVHYNHQVSQ